MYCRKCGCKVEDNWTYCPRCRNYLKDNVNLKNNAYVVPNANNDLQKEKEKEKENNEALIYLGVFFFCIFAIYETKLTTPFFIASVITIVTAYIKCKNNTLVKVIFWLYIVYVVCMVIFFLILLIACNQFFGDCSSLGSMG